MSLILFFHRPAVAIWLAFWVTGWWITPQSRAEPTVLRVMTANLNGNSQTYEPFALRIFQGLKPDIVAIQEFNYLNNSEADIRSFVDTAFGSDYSYYREAGYSIPNGIISRRPILASGSWSDVLQGNPNRGFAWAKLDLPGTNDLYVVSVHLLSGAGPAARAEEAQNLLALIQTNFPPNAWLVVAGDLNTDSRAENAVTIFKTVLSDSPQPTDAVAGGNPNTNEPRNKPYDFVLPSISFAAQLTNLDIGSLSFPNGLVFDSRIFPAIADIPPVLAADSGNAQHMGVLKAFLIERSGFDTNTPGQRPVITTQPANQIVLPGQPVTFSVTAIGDSPLAYQWLFNGAVLAGATSNSYAILEAAPANVGTYMVVITNSAGKATSTGATLALATTNVGNIIAQWNFNQTDSVSASPLPSIGLGSAALIGGVAATFASGAPTDPGIPNSAWNTANFPAQGAGNKTAGVQFNLSTAGRRNLSIRWDARASNTGSKYSRLLFTTNGVLFQEFPIAVRLNAAATFESVTNALTGIPGVENNPAFAFRIVAEFESTTGFGSTTGYVGANGTYGSAGTLRFDEVTVSGTPIANEPPGAPTLTIDYSAGQTNGFRFLVNGTPGARYAIQHESDLAGENWVSVATNTAPFTFSATHQGLDHPRFFRSFGIK